ncbi:hypothetical protein MASR2M66_01590 [Chloroflexota bacterium]
MYSPFTTAAEGGGVAVGGSGVEVGTEGLGVLEVPKEAQADSPATRKRVKYIRL